MFFDSILTLLPCISSNLFHMLHSALFQYFQKPLYFQTVVAFFDVLQDVVVLCYVLRYAFFAFFEYFQKPFGCLVFHFQMFSLFLHLCYHLQTVGLFFHIVRYAFFQCLQKPNCLSCYLWQNSIWLKPFDLNLYLLRLCCFPQIHRLEFQIESYFQH